MGDAGMVAEQAHSVSAAISGLMSGPPIGGWGLGAGYVEFAGVVLALVPPGRPRMPNGLVTGLVVDRGEPATIGQGRLTCSAGTVAMGPTWDPVPRALVVADFVHPFVPDIQRLVGRGPGLTPAGDDLIVGFLAGRALFGKPTTGWLPEGELSTTALSRTLIRLAIVGAVPEPVHALVEHADIRPLLAFGRSSGRWLAVGLCLGASDLGPAPVSDISDLSLSAADDLLGRCGFRMAQATGTDR